MRAWDTSAMVSLWQSGQFVGAGSLIPPCEFRDWTQGLELGGQHLYLWSRPEESGIIHSFCVCIEERPSSLHLDHIAGSLAFSDFLLSSVRIEPGILDVPDNCYALSNVPSLPFSSDKNIRAVKLKLVKSRYVAFLWPGLGSSPVKWFVVTLTPQDCWGKAGNFSATFSPYCCFVFPLKFQIYQNPKEASIGRKTYSNLMSHFHLTLLSEQLTSLIGMTKE